MSVNILKNTSDFIKRGIGERIHNHYLNTVDIKTYRMKNPKEAELLNRNKKFKDIHKGKRCFILGSGPSLKDIDFSLLKNEYIFGVNRIMRVDGWENLNLNYWVCFDGGCFGLWDVNLKPSEVMSDFGKLANFPELECFIPIEAIRFVKGRRVDKLTNINYMIGKLDFCNEYDNEVDLTKYLGKPCSVVERAIEIAIYMGFSEIYLLGCDGTTIKAEIDSMLNKEIKDVYAFNSSSSYLDNIIKRNVKHMGMHGLLFCQHRIFLEYSILSRYCSERNIKLVNLSSTTLIDSIPRMNFSDVISIKN